MLSDDVKSALASGKPVVALESTIITHGMPYPQNLHTAREVEAVVGTGALKLQRNTEEHHRKTAYRHATLTPPAITAQVRSNGAVPATIAVLHGVPHIGLSPEQLEYLAQVTRYPPQLCIRAWHPFPGCAPSCGNLHKRQHAHQTHTGATEPHQWHGMLDNACPCSLDNARILRQPTPLNRGDPGVASACSPARPFNPACASRRHAANLQQVAAVAACGVGPVRA